MDSFDLIKNLDMKNNVSYKKSTLSCLFDDTTANDIKRHIDCNKKVLAWLLDPNESHGLGTKFLEDFLSIADKKIDKKIGKNNTYKVEVDYAISSDYATKNSTIDILIESSDTIFAIDCSGIGSRTPRSIKQYKDYFENILKPDKDVVYIFMRVGHCSSYGGDIDHIQFSKITYEELLDFLPTNLDSKYQNFIDNYVKYLEINCAEQLTTAGPNKLIEGWRNLRKYGVIINKLVNYFDISIDFKMLFDDYRKYYTSPQNCVFIMFECKENKLDFSLGLKNLNQDFYEKLLKKADEIGLKSEEQEITTLLQNIELINNDEKSMEELIELIKNSNILENYKTLLKECE